MPLLLICVWPMWYVYVNDSRPLTNSLYSLANMRMATTVPVMLQEYNVFVHICNNQKYRIMSPLALNTVEEAK